jgi:hypothetical protein
MADNSGKAWEPAKFLLAVAGLVMAVAGLRVFGVSLIAWATWLSPLTHEWRQRHRTASLLVASAIIIGGVTASVWDWWASRASDRKPIAVLSTRIEDAYTAAYIVVMNDGTVPVDVWADIETLRAFNFNGLWLGQIFHGYWEGSRNQVSRLRPGQRDRLQVSEIGHGAPFKADSDTVGLVFFDPETGGRNSIRQIWSDKVAGIDSSVPKLVLEVTLRADPPIDSGKIVKWLHLHAGGLDEDIAPEDTVR